MGDRAYFYIPPLKELKAIPKPARVKGDRWGYCGIAAISAAISVPPLDVYKAIPDWHGYTPSRMIIKTLKEFGFECLRTLVPKEAQRQWPHLAEQKPSSIALGRVYYGEGKYADSHWVCFKWGFSPNPMLYDNALASLSEFGERWIFTKLITFFAAPAKLKSLYFVRRYAR